MYSEETIIKLAQERGWVSVEEIEECNAQQKQFTGRSLLTILLENGYIFQEQVDQLDAEGALEEDEEEAFLSSDVMETETEDMDVSDILPSVEEMSLKDMEEENLLPSKPETKIPEEQLVFDDEISPEIKQLPPEPVEKKQSALVKLPELPKNSISTPFGKAAVLLHMVTEDQVEKALLLQVTRTPHQKLGEILVENGNLTPQQVKRILERQKSKIMYCRSCKKKYTIVLYQAGKEYKCKKCREKLAILKKTSKKKLQKSEKFQVMGLTQELPQMSRYKRKRTEKQPAQKNEQKQENHHQASLVIPKPVTTEKQLKDVGLEVPDIIPEFTKKEQLTIRNKYSLVIGLLLLITCCAAFFAYHYFLGDNTPVPKTMDSPSVENTAKPPVENPEQKEYENLISIDVDGMGEGELQRELFSCRQYLEKHTNSKFRNEIIQRIARINHRLGRLQNNRLLRQKYNQAETQLFLMKKQGQFQQALAHIELLQNEFSGSEWREKLSRLRQEIEDKSLQVLVEKSKKAGDRREYKKAIAILQNSLSQQPARHLREIEWLIENWQQKQKKFQAEWWQVAHSCALEIIPYAHRDHYDKIIRTIKRYDKKYPAYHREWTKWKTGWYNAYKMRMAMRRILKKYQKRKIYFTLNRKVRNKQKIKGVMWAFREKSSVPILIKETDGNFVSLKISWLSTATLQRYLKKQKKLSLFFERFAFALFLFPSRNIYGFKMQTPELCTGKKSDPEKDFYRETIACYLVAQIEISIQSKQIKSIGLSLKALDKYYRNTSSFAQHRQSLEESMDNYVESTRKKSKRNADLLETYIDKYLSY